MTTYHLTTPVSDLEIRSLAIGDIVYLSGTLFTARDRAHRYLADVPSEELLFPISQLALYHSGPLMKKKDDGSWEAISAGPTTSSRMEIYQEEVIRKHNINFIIGKGSMGEKTRRALKECGCVYTVYTGGCGALAAENIKRVEAVYLLEEFGMAEAIWILRVEEFGPLIVTMK